MALTDVALCTRALIKLGVRPITSFTDGSAESEIASLLYAPSRDGLLSSYALSFATLQVNLTMLFTQPIAYYDYAYSLPTDLLRVISVGANGTGKGIEFRMYRDVIHSNAESLILTYIARVPESICPPYFDVALMARLSAEFCLPLTENTSRADLLAKLADTEFMKARQIDAQQDTPNRLNDFTLINSRF
jgi:hypothetical protein